jgi:hypothetical protein
MIEDIDKNGELKNTKAPLSWYLTNFHTIDSWTIGLPKTEKYLKHEVVLKTTKKIQLCRRIMAYTFPIMVICGIILFSTVV